MAKYQVEFPMDVWNQVIDQSDKATLATLARVSKSLRDSAIPALYRCMDGPWTLMRLLEVEQASQVRGAAPVSKFLLVFRPRD